MLTYVLKTEWSVTAAGAALRPVAMQIADCSGGFLVCVPAPHEIFPSGWIYGGLTQTFSDILCGKSQQTYSAISVANILGL